ncbi:putative orexin receptor type 2-like [Apostichopus japonicus]|uniref:Putative orexin receptor type 2-like n=1 Tax=Stichopus japonicus TaxID=307972 RepID=A0A2G8LLP6_STIJA|nr:putative orexin receptor type 2-like [Apostichopus japonicus]
MAFDSIGEILEIIVGFAGLFGNSLVLFVFFRTRSLRSLINLLIMNQSLIDVTTSIVFLALHLSPPILLDSESKWHRIFCSVWLSEYPLWALLISSAINLCCITLDRFFAVMFPISYKKTAGRKGIILAATVVFTWTAGFIFDSYWAFIQVVTPEGFCYPSWRSKVLQGVVGFFIFTITYLAPLGIMAFSYMCILWKLKKQASLTSGTIEVSTLQNDPAGQRRPQLTQALQDDTQTKKTSKKISKAKSSVLKTMLSVSLVYAICWAPIAISYLLYNFGGYLDFTSRFYVVTKLFVDSNMAVNPFIYTFQYRQFQEALARTFGIRLGWGTRVTPATTRG